MAVILLKIKLTGNCLHRLSMNCLWRYDQLSHALLLMIFYIILIIVTLSRDWNLLYVSTRMSNEGKEKEAEKLGYIWWYQKGIAYPWETLQWHPPDAMATALRYVLDAPAKNTHTCPSDSSTKGLGGWFGLTTILTVPHIQLPRSLVQQPPSIHILPPSSLSNQAAQQVCGAVYSEVMTTVSEMPQLYLFPPWDD